MKEINLGSHRWGPESNRKLEYIKWKTIPNKLELKYNRNVLKRRFYDRDYEKVIVLFFQSGAGGLFLTNCLSLSNSVCSSFIRTSDKVKLWYKYLNSQKIFWNDLYLNNYSPEVLFDHDLDWGNTTDGYFFIYEHLYENIPLHLEFWNNGSIIYFKNPDLFCKIRKLLKNIDGELAHKSYEPLMPDKKEYPIPSSFSDFFKLSIEEQEKLKNAYARDDSELESYLKDKKFLYVWDTNWYFSEEDTVTHIRELYDIFGLENFNEELVSLFYRMWISKLDKLSKTRFAQNPKQFETTKLLADKKYYDVPICNFEDIPNV